MIAVATFPVSLCLPTPQPSVLALGVDFEKETCLEFRMLLDFLYWNIIINSRNYFRIISSSNIGIATTCMRISTVCTTPSTFLPLVSDPLFPWVLGSLPLCILDIFFSDQYSSGSFVNISGLAKLLLTHLNSFFN